MQPQYKIYFTTKICESSKEQKKTKTEYICIKMVVLQLSDKWINSPKNAKRNPECLISQLTACYCVTTNADCTLAHLFTCENYSLWHEAESLLLKLNVQTYTKKTRRIIKPLCFTRRNVTVLCTILWIRALANIGSVLKKRLYILRDLGKPGYCTGVHVAPQRIFLEIRERKKRSACPVWWWMFIMISTLICNYLGRSAQ